MYVRHRRGRASWLIWRLGRWGMKSLPTRNPISTQSSITLSRSYPNSCTDTTVTTQGSHENINTQIAHFMMNSFVPNGVYDLTNVDSSKYLYLSCNNVYDWSSQ